MNEKLYREIELALVAAKDNVRPCHSKLDNVIARLEIILKDFK